MHYHTKNIPWWYITANNIMHHNTSANTSVEKQQSATQTLLIFSAHDIRGTYRSAHRRKQWTCRNFPFPLKGSSPNSCSSPGGGAQSQSPPSVSFHLLHSVSICPAVLTFLSHSLFTVTSCLSVLTLQIFPPWNILICLSLSETLRVSLSGVSAAVRNVTLFYNHAHVKHR